jgi:hypothetical protein
MENRSLDDFLDTEGAESGETAPSDTDTVGEGETPADPAQPGSASDTEAETTRVGPAAVESAETTYAAGRGECGACGESARERWRGEAGLVCPACKEW